MLAAAQLRNRIEAALADRIPAALSPSPREVRHTIASGFDEIDQILRGGLPCAAMTELIGAECSGRTSMALAYVAATTQTENVCAWIDVADCLDPEMAAANGVELENLLWVRCGAGPVASSQPMSGSPQGAAPLLSDAGRVQRHSGGGSPHPRSEGRDMPQAIGELMRTQNAHTGLPSRRDKRGIGTPGAQNRPLSSITEVRQEQVASDRMPARRGENLAIVSRCAEPQRLRTGNQTFGHHQPIKPLDPSYRRTGAVTERKPWKALDHALRATDLLLQSGGFRLIVLDLGSTTPEIASRIPMATWFRFRAACERTSASLLLLTQYPCARSSAELVVRLEKGIAESDGLVLNGVRYYAAAERSRVASPRVVAMRKPPQAERPGQWRCGALWAQHR